MIVSLTGHLANRKKATSRLSYTARSTDPMNSQDENPLANPTAIVQDQYAATARSSLSNDDQSVRAVAAAFGYSEEELALLPAEANMGLSCGNPVALASLRPGEVVVDLGCGGGLDVFLAAHKVGPSGKAIGIDMTPEMLDRARAGAAKQGLANVEFLLAQITELPLPDNSVDCLISNCVINLVDDKDAAFREMYRVLKPGGRVALSDIALKQLLPPAIQNSIEAYVGCISGAILIEDYRRRLEKAGFAAVVVTETGADLNVYAEAGVTSSVGCCASPVGESVSGCCGANSDVVSPPSDFVPTASLNSTSNCLPVLEDSKPSSRDNVPTIHDQLKSVFAEFDANAYAASVRVQALKV
jgi:arsenite methyltransferase